MARSFRYYGKKRGNRRTGSSTLGSAGEMLFYAVFLLFGCVSAVALFYLLVIPQWRVSNEFVEHTCIVLQKRIAEEKDQDGTLYRPEFRIKYEIDGVEYFAWTYGIHKVSSSSRKNSQKILGRFTETKDPEHPIEYPCWYDPLNPEKVVLVRGGNWWMWLIAIVPVSFILIGGIGLIYRVLHWGKSAEHQAAMARHATRGDLFDTGNKAAGQFPNVPPGADITNSPGTRLAFRLPIGASPGWKLFGILLACVLWNGIVSVFVVFVAKDHLGGNPDWVLTLFLLPFVVVGIALIVCFIRQLLLTTGVGPTMVEISDHPLVPGRQYRLFVSQAGRLVMNSLCVSLVCEEKATYRQGTDTRTETKKVHDREVYRRDGFEVRRGLPFEDECELLVPEGAMHSFKSDHNEIHWKLVVAGDVAVWPNYKRDFPVVIHPAVGRTDT